MHIPNTVSRPRCGGQTCKMPFVHWMKPFSGDSKLALGEVTMNNWLAAAKHLMETDAPLTAPERLHKEQSDKVHAHIVSHS